MSTGRNQALDTNLIRLDEQIRVYEPITLEMALECVLSVGKVRPPLSMLCALNSLVRIHEVIWLRCRLLDGR